MPFTNAMLCLKLHHQMQEGLILKPSIDPASSHVYSKQAFTPPMLSSLPSSERESANKQDSSSRIRSGVTSPVVKVLFLTSPRQEGETRNIYVCLWFVFLSAYFSKCTGRASETFVSYGM